jgi:hypothetical protein
VIRTTRIKTRKTKRRSLRRYSDDLWSQLIKTIYGNACYYCHGTQAIQSAHIIGRAHMVTRFNVKNGIAMCHTHHRAFDTYALDRDKLIVMAIGVEAYEGLKLAAQKPWSKEYPVAALRAAIKALGSGGSMR